MTYGGRQAQCPNCGGPIELKLGSSAALVCPFCRFSVVRTDRDLRAIGKVADLVPTAPPMTVGDLGTFRDPMRGADDSFRVGGRLQLDHGKGPWDEWYVALADGSWGWLARAQGKWYLTRPVSAAGLPSWEQMSPGQSGQLPGTAQTVWTAVERGTSRLVSAEGELPFPIVPGQVGRYVDLQGPGGLFGTIDYGDGQQPPVFFAGGEIPAEHVRFTDGGGGPRPVEKIEAKKLGCPTCGAPVPIFVPSATERAVCQACHSILDVQAGNLSLLGQLEQPHIRPMIPLGQEGTLRGRKVMCIGFMERFTVIEGVSYAWREYLLHSEQGFSWLVEDSRNFTHVTPANAADVRVLGSTATYQGRTFRRFSDVRATVRFVIGEFYWKVQVGETAIAGDYIAPPYLLSQERSDQELIWSFGEYIPGDEIWRSFTLPGSAPKAVDVAPAAPNPVNLGRAAITALVLLAAMVGAYFVTRPKQITEVPLVQGQVQVPPVADATYTAMGTGVVPVAGVVSPTAASFTPSFTVPPGTPAIEVVLNSDLGNGWLGVAVAFVNEQTGDLYETVLEQDRFHDPGAAQGLPQAASVFIELPPGNYGLRLDPHWARKPGAMGEAIPPAATIDVHTSNGSDPASGCCCFSLVLLLLPLFFQVIRRSAFEKRRWEASNLQ